VEARLSFDTAFVLEGAEPARQAAADLFRNLDLDPGRSAVLSVRAFDSMYTHDDAAFVQRMGVLCRGFREAGLTPVVLIQSRAYGADNDLAVARSIQAQAPGTAILDPFLAEGAVPSWQVAMGVFDLAQRVVAVRYHTAVLSLAVGRVPFHLHYSNKGRDLCQRLELPGDDLGRFDPQRTLETILASPPAGFDHRAMRERIRSDFTWAMAQLDPQGKP
jgi:polysaccharide pyruvyl transferase WcaK-like protein